jgi:hypothetical protein
MPARLYACVIAIFAVSSAASAQPAVLPPLERVIVPLPPGPYATWPAEDRDAAVRSLFSRCAMDNVSSFGRGYQGPADATRESWTAQTYACVVRKMPADWPLAARARAEAVAHYEAARNIDPKVPPLNFPD